MMSYLLRRLWQMVPTLAGVVLGVFFLFKGFGGDPAEILAGLNASPEQVEQIREQLGLNRPVWEQLAIFVGHFAAACRRCYDGGWWRALVQGIAAFVAFAAASMWVYRPAQFLLALWTM